MAVESSPRTAIEEAMHMLEPLSAGNSHRDVLDALSRMIDSAGLTIGDRLPPEIEIARRMGIGRAKVREALTAWQNMGIVTRNKKAGTRLAAEVSSNAIHIPLTVKLEAESLLRTHSVRRPLEIEAVRLAATHLTEAERRIILARARELMAVYEAGEDWRKADNRFHVSIHEASGNPLFGQIIHQIQQGFNEIYDAPFGQPHLGQCTIPLHMPLAEAIADQEAAEAMALMRTIMDRVEAEVRQVMDAQNG